MKPEQSLTPPHEASVPQPIPVEYMADNMPDDLRQRVLDEVESAANALEAASGFVRNSEAFGTLVGMRGLNIRIGEGWTTNMETGEVTVDPSFFLEKGFRPEWCTYGILHELSAHLREVITEPELTRDVIRFGRQGQQAAEFHNVVTDIAGNRDIHRRLPRMAEVAAEVYEEKMARGTDQRQYNPEMDPEGVIADRYGHPIPRHVQFLNKLLRDEMIPDGETIVSPEVEAAITGLRDYQGTGQDAIKAATDPYRKARERFDIQVGLLYPVYLELLEQDKADPEFQQEPQQDQGADGDPQPGQGEGQPSEGQPGQQRESGDQSEQSKGSESSPQQSSEQSGQGQADFSRDYEIMDERHPEPFSEEQERQIQRIADKLRKTETPSDRAARAMEQQTGHSQQEIQNYRRELGQFGPEIEQMQDFFESIISKRLQLVRRLGRPSQEGAILDPSLLAQAHVDVQSGVTDPPTFLNYERFLQQEQAVGGYDLYLVVDSSGSMKRDEKSKMAASSAMIFTEGLDLFEQRIKEVEEQERTRLDLDVQTQVMTFGDNFNTMKPLSPVLTEKQRLDMYSEVIKADSGSTQDFLALEEIIRSHEAQVAASPDVLERKRIVIVETDGQSDDSARAGEAITRLRELGFKVIGIGIKDQSAENLFHPDGKTIQDARELPNTLINIIQTELA